MLTMKHVVQIKLPKIFGKKKENEPDVTTEIHLEDSVMDLKDVAMKVAPFAGTLAVGILIGNNHALKKALKASVDARITIIK